MWRQFIAEIAIAVAVVRVVALSVTHDRRVVDPLPGPGTGVAGDWRGRTTVAVGLTAWIVTGWLLVAGAVGLTQPTLAASTPTAFFIAVVGQTARITQADILGFRSRSIVTCTTPTTRGSRRMTMASITSS
jgi:hypothetical protein